MHTILKFVKRCKWVDKDSIFLKLTGFKVIVFADRKRKLIEFHNQNIINWSEMINLSYCSHQKTSLFKKIIWEIKEITQIINVHYYKDQFEG